MKAPADTSVIEVPAASLLTELSGPRVMPLPLTPTAPPACTPPAITTSPATPVIVAPPVDATMVFVGEPGSPSLIALPPKPAVPLMVTVAPEIEAVSKKVLTPLLVPPAPVSPPP